MAVLANFRNKSKLIIKTKVFWLGLFINISVLIYLFFFSPYYSLNAMNEAIYYGIQELFSGNNPYSRIYELSIHQETYDSYLGYPPVVLLLYAPAILSPMIGTMQFHPIMYMQNLFFDYLIFSMFYNPEKRFTRYVGYLYWLNPLLGVMQYASFYSVLFLFMIYAINNINNPIKSGIGVAMSISVYHMTVIMLPLLFVYQIRSFFAVREGEVYSDERIEPVDSEIKPIPICPEVISWNATFWQKLKDIKTDIVGSLENALKFLLTCGIVGLLWIPFIITDFDGFARVIFREPPLALGLGIVRLVFLICILINAIGLLFIRKQYIAKIYIGISLLIIFFIQGTILAITAYVVHYYALLIPIACPVSLFYPYDFLAAKPLQEGSKSQTINQDQACEE